MKSIQATLCINSEMEITIQIGIKSVRPPLDYSNESKKHHITQYNHIIDHESWCKSFLNFCEQVTRVMI